MDKTEKLLEKQAIMGLRKCVAGFKFEEVKITYDVDENGLKRIKSEVVTTKNISPDLSAIIFTLTNLDPKRWRTKPDVATSNVENEERIDLSDLSELALRELSGYIEKTI